MSRKHVCPPQGAPSWMVTFGDLMSLLLVFFVLLFSVSEVKQQKIYEVVRSIRTYWQVDAPTAGFHIEQFDEVVQALAERAAELPDQKFGWSGKTSTDTENPFGEFTQVSQIKDSLRLDIEGRVLFDQGSAELKSQGRRIIERVRDRLLGYPNRIRIVGHASPEPLAAAAPYDHYDLGFMRAKAVMAVLVNEGGEKQGIRPERVEASSVGRNNPLAGVDMFDPVNRARIGARPGCGPWRRSMSRSDMSRDRARARGNTRVRSRSSAGERDPSSRRRTVP